VIVEGEDIFLNVIFPSWPFGDIERFGQQGLVGADFLFGSLRSVISWLAP